MKKGKHEVSKKSRKHIVAPNLKKEKKYINNKKGKNKVKNIITILLIIIFLICIRYLFLHFFKLNKEKKEIDQLLDSIEIDEKILQNADQNITERMLKLQKLQEQNSDIIAWIEIEGTNINYPVMQCEDNNFYMNHDYKKEASEPGSIFLDANYDWSIPSSNLLMYGHNMKNGSMFHNLLNYKNESYYKEHPTIRFTTTEEDSTYEILAVFESRVYYKSEKNVFRYYQFINAKNEEEFNKYVENSKKSSLYDTGVTAKYGDQLMTLSTCAYHTEDGRFVVVARKK